MKLKLLLLGLAALSVWLLFLDRKWLLGRLRLHSAPVVLLALGVLLVVSWLFGVVLTRVLNLPQAEPFSVLGVGLVATSAVGGSLALLNMVRRWLGRA